jgi:alkylation response protein AidB-like acyl-CoA dehydrogenase
MDFNLTDEQQMLREGAERFLQESYTFEHRRQTLGLGKACDEKTWRSFAELGWLALAVPETSGGLGAGPVEIALLAEALGRRMVLEPVATTAVLSARILERADHPDLAMELLGEIAAGDVRVAVACLEPGRRYDVSEPSTRAERGGADFTLRGAKALVLDAPAAHKFIVSATLEDGAGCGLFIVDADAAGLTQRSYPLIDGRHASDLALSDVRVPASAMLCGGKTAVEVLDEALDRYAASQVADALGAMEAIIEQTAEHLRNRKQFGQPLAAFQALQHRVAEMFVEVQETRSALYHALANLGADPALRNAAISSAMVVASEAGRIVGGQGIQLHGGVGMTEEYQVGHFFKRLLVFEKCWGDVDYHLDRIARTYR